MNNKVLFGVLVLLLGVAYYSEEVVKKEEVKAKKIEMLLFSDLKEFSEFSTDKYSLIKKAKSRSWDLKKFSLPVNDKAVDELVKILEGLTIDSKKEIQSADLGKYTRYVNSKFFIKTDKKRGNLNRKKFILGDVSEISGKFYLIEVQKNKYFLNICEDRSHLGSPYKSELELKFKKYLRLKSIVNGNAFLFADNLLINSLGVKGLTKVRIDNNRNRWFEVDLANNITIPPAPKALRALDLQQQFENFAQKLKIISIIKPGQNILDSKISEMILKGKEEITIKLYGSLNGKFGRYVKVSSLDYIYELSPEAKEVFFSNVQDFWHKKIVFNQDFLKLKKFTYEVGFKQDSLQQFQVTDTEKFNIVYQGKDKLEFSKTHMNFLFNLLFNLADFKQAKYVEEFDKNKFKSRKGELIVKLFGREFRIKIQERLIVISDFENSLNFFYNYDNTQISPSFFDALFTVAPK